MDAYSTAMLLHLVTSHQLDAEKFAAHHFRLNEFDKAYDVFSRAASGQHQTFIRGRFPACSGAGGGQVISSTSWKRMTPNQSLFSARISCSASAATSWITARESARLMSASSCRSRPAIRS